MRASNALYSIPNVLSVLRGIAGPIVLALLMAGQPLALAAALALMIAAEISDFLDGLIARRFDQDTKIGRLIDPICDSIYHLSVFLAFLAKGWMPAWMLFIIYARDLMVPYLRTFAQQFGHELSVRTSGKVKTTIHAIAQIGVVTIAMGQLGSEITIDGQLASALLLAAMLASLYSLIDYCVEVARVVKS